MKEHWALYKIQYIKKKKVEISLTLSAYFPVFYFILQRSDFNESNIQGV